MLPARIPERRKQNLTGVPKCIILNCSFAERKKDPGENHGRTTYNAKAYGSPFGENGPSPGFCTAAEDCGNGGAETARSRKICADAGNAADIPDG